MSTHTMTERRSPAPGYPEATSVGDHLVIDRTEWVPGPDPQPHRRDPDQDAYPESYFYCLRCGVEALRLRDLPPTCEADHGDSGEPTDRAEEGSRDRLEPTGPGGRAD